MPLLLRAVSLALRCSISEFVSSMDMLWEIKHKAEAETKQTNGDGCVHGRVALRLSEFSHLCLYGLGSKNSMRGVGLHVYAGSLF